MAEDCVAQTNNRIARPVTGSAARNTNMGHRACQMSHSAHTRHHHVGKEQVNVLWHLSGVGAGRPVQR